MNVTSIRRGHSACEDKLLQSEMDTELLHRLSSCIAQPEGGNWSMLLGLQNRFQVLKCEQINETNQSIQLHSANHGRDCENCISDNTNTIVRGEDIGDMPIEYTLRGLHTYEKPVIGE